VQPRLREIQRAARHPSVHSAEREAAAKSYHSWQMVSDALNLVVIGGLLVYVWRVTNPPDATRYISSVKFRG